MKFKAYTGITWSLLELKGLIEDENSNVHFERVKKHYGLHPFHLTNLHAAFNEILSSNLNSYDAELKGFPLAYKNPTVITPLGEVFYDTCFIHVDVEADFYIFRPQLNNVLKGVVNKKGLNHIGVLVHKAFNVSIPSPEDAEDWVGHSIEIGEEIKFTITHLDFDSKLPCIRGVLNEEEYLQYRQLDNKNNVAFDTKETITKKKRSKSEKKARSSCTSADENNDDTLNSEVEDIKKNDLKPIKKSLKKNYDIDESVNSGIKKHAKKLAKKLKEAHSTSESDAEIDTKPLDRISKKRKYEHSDVEETDSELTPKQSIKKFNNFVTPETPDKISSKKRSKKLKASDSDFEFDISRVKDDPDYATDSCAEKKVDSKRRSKNKSKDTDTELQNNEETSKTPQKVNKQPKKSKLKSNLPDFEVQVKTEETDYDSETKITATPKKRRSKPKCSAESDATDNEKPAVGDVKKSTKKLKDSSMVFDYDDVTVKNEKSNDSKKALGNRFAEESTKQEQTDDNNEQAKKPSKKLKKLGRSYHDLSSAEDEYTSVEIKSENNETTNDNDRKNSFETPKNVTTKKNAPKSAVLSPANNSHDNGESEFVTVSTQHATKQRKSNDVDAINGVKVKHERSLKREDTAYSNTEMNSEDEEVKSNKTFAKKQSRKRKMSTVDSLEDSPEIKVEK